MFWKKPLTISNDISVFWQRKEEELFFCFHPFFLVFSWENNFTSFITICVLYENINIDRNHTHTRKPYIKKLCNFLATETESNLLLYTDWLYGEILSVGKKNLWPESRIAVNSFVPHFYCFCCFCLVHSLKWLSLIMEKNWPINQSRNEKTTKWVEYIWFSNGNFYWFFFVFRFFSKVIIWHILWSTTKKNFQSIIIDILNILLWKILHFFT